nr:hypothetical protein [Tanacetum cinerariifolium]
KNEGISFVQEDAETQGRYGYDIEVNTASTSITTASINITTAEPVTNLNTPVTTTGVSVSTTEPSTPPTTTNEEEERMARQKEEDVNITKWDDVQAMMDADHELAERLQAEEQGESTIEER